MFLCDLIKKIEYVKIINEKLNPNIKGLVIDSRQVEEGVLFACIRGTKVDGHNFIDEVISKGALVILCEQIPEIISDKIVYICVNSVREKLAYIASEFYGNPAERLRFIGITGTKGKTSTAHFVERILATALHSIGTIGTTGIKINGNDLNIPFTTSTTPDTIELHSIFRSLCEQNAEFVVMEVSSHALELKKLEGVCFEVGIFTNLTRDHLDFHGTMENYYLAKKKLFDKCKKCIINIDDEYGKRLYDEISNEKEVITYSEDMSKSADFSIKNILLKSDSVEYNVRYKNQNFDVKLPIAGKFTVYNSIAAIAAVVSVGIPIETAVLSMKTMTGVPGRIQNLPNNKGIGVFIDYAHTPDSLKQIIESVREFTEGKVITVFGCGGDKDKGKRPIMGRISAELSDITVVTTDNPRSEKPETISAEIAEGFADLADKIDSIIINDRKEAICYAIKKAKSGDSVIIAGKGHETYQEFENKRRIHFDDFEVAKLFLEEK